MKNHIFKLAAAEDASPARYRATVFSGKEKRNNNMMNFIAIMCVFVGGYGVRWLCEVMQEVKQTIFFGDALGVGGSVRRPNFLDHIQNETL